MPPSSSGGRQTILVTGGSGVLGTALLPRLRGHKVICLTHRGAVSRSEEVPGDLTSSLLGLSASEYRRLAESVTCVIHAAAVTNFSDPDLERVNVEGTRRVCEFVNASEAHLLHVSTAFVGTGQGSQGGSLRYAASKREAEAIVTAAVHRATIARPSIVVGESTTGRIARYQGVYQVAGAVMTGRLPIAPVDPTWILDLIPQDLAANALANLVDGRRAGRVVWLTTGPASLSLSDAADVLVGLAAEAGMQVLPPRFLDPEMYERLIAPVLLPALPAEDRASLRNMMDHLFEYMSLREPFPTSIPGILGAGLAPQPAELLRRCMSVWAVDRGIAGFASVPIVDSSIDGEAVA